MSGTTYNMEETRIDVREDGVTHINVWSKGQTRLGRSLSNFARIGFEVRGKFFESMEGYWYWVKTGCQHDELKALWGFKAKEVGRQYDPVPVDQFEQRICDGLAAKLRCNPVLALQLTRSTLPLTHYFVFARGNSRALHVPKSGEFQIAFLERERARLQQEQCDHFDAHLKQRH